jgi:ubiquinone/menaquinone biosynthesis C-methylase UbiE
VNASLNLEAERPTAKGYDVNTIPVSVSQGYERWAPLYDNTPNPLLACEERYLFPLLMDLRGKRILDLACGTGRWLQKLAVQGGAFGVGVDRSGAMLRIAGKKDAIAGRLARATCESLPFRTAVFDLAICSFALGHIQDLESMVHELARVTAPGANVFISDLHPDAYAQGWRVGFRDQSSAIQIETLPRSAEEIILAFKGEGFECLGQVSLCLEKPEKAIFVSAGRSHLFEAACRLPAVLVCHFRLRHTETKENSAPHTLRKYPPAE